MSTQARWVLVSFLAIAVAAVLSSGEDRSPPAVRSAAVPGEGDGASAPRITPTLRRSGSPPGAGVTSQRPAPLDPEPYHAASLFDDPGALDEFHAGMNRVTGTLTRDRARERFGALGVDTEENKDRALRLATMSYSVQREREEVRRKVLAQYFLAYSERLGVEECLDALSENMALSRSHSATTDLGRAYALDVLVLAKICARKSEEAVARLVQDEGDPTVRAQLDSALASVLEEGSRLHDE